MRNGNGWGGARNRKDRLSDALTRAQCEAITQAAIEKALGGDTAALRMCLDRIAPARKDSPITMTLPKVETVRDAVAASQHVLAAVAAGEVTPDEAARVMALLTAHKSLVEVGDIEGRIAALEAKQ
jgi:hypothetical protein